MDTKEENKDKAVLPHHEQLPLCTTRLPYRQGRKLTAVKTYTINSESPHLLVFGVPSLNLRREAKDLFVKFGRLIQFTLMKELVTEVFTETYHAQYDRIQSARIAKKMIDTKNFYGGILHVCYAPELETIDETRSKLLQRKKEVSFRLKNLQKESLTNNKKSNLSQIEPNKDINSHVEPNFTNYSQVKPNSNIDSQIESDFNVNSKSPITVFKSTEIINEIKYKLDVNNDKKKLNMGENNLIYLNSQKSKKIKKDIAVEKRFKPYFINQVKNDKSKGENFTENSTDIVDCTSVEKHVISNINDALNYNKFGNELIRKVDIKPTNKIVFNNNKRS